MVRKIIFSFLILALAQLWFCGDVLEDNISKKTINMLAPSDVAIITDDTISFWWDHLSGATEYEFHLVSPSLSSPTRVLVDTITSHNLLTFQVKEGSYEWEVRALNNGYSTDYFYRSFTVVLSSDSTLVGADISNQNVALLVPQNNADLIGTNVSFWWEALEGADTYRFWLAQPDFTNPEIIIVDTVISTTKFTIPLLSGNYEWKVKAMNDTYSTAYVTRSFNLAAVQIIDISTETIQIVTPQNNASLYGQEVSFRWDQIEDAVEYEFQLYTPTIANPIEVIEDQILADRTLNLTLDPGDFEWRVRASNNDSKTDWTVGKFTLDSELVTDISDQLVILRAPADSLSTSSNDINFWWDKVAGADNYQLMIATPSFEDNEIEMLVYDNNTVENIMTVNLDSGLYQWAVKAINSRYETVLSKRVIYINK